jgi:simple sugar transport system ATP-binding protein
VTVANDTPSSPALELRGVDRSFGSVRALHNVSLRVRSGTVHALLGENGAGKTTLMRVAFGLVSPDQGSVAVQGEPMHNHTAISAIEHGLGMVHQHFSLVSAMTVAENVALGARGRYNASQVAEHIRTIGERTGLSIDPLARVSDLSVSAQQRCEIIKALARDARVLILDEPTAVLAPDEAQALLQWLRGFVAERTDHAVVLITHKLRDALAIADDITVLRRGEVVATGSADTFSEATLADHMLGPGDRAHAVEDELMPHITRHTDSVGAHHVVLQADALTVHDVRGVPRVRNASFAVRAGEIVGLAAVEGSGQAELLRAMAGLLPIASGRRHAPADIGFVPEDRHRDALLLDASLTENFALRGAGLRRGRVPWSELAARASDVLRQRDVRAPNVRVLARTLSGGNQQKFILARALDDAPSALIIENPTRGLDFRAAAAVHDALRDARDAGIAILFFSSDLDEVLTRGDRVLAMHDGVLREVPRERDVVGRAMLAAS